MKKENFIIYEDESILAALKKIDANKKGFVMVLHRDDTVKGTLTDGDIRRSLIKGLTVEAAASSSCSTKFKYLSESEEFDHVIDFFRDASVDFIPIINREKKLVNIITRSTMQSLLLRDHHPDIHYDFLSVEDNLEYEIYRRPWGFYKTTILNEMFQSKLISVRPGQALSLQMHRKREEHWIIVHGSGIVQLDESEKPVEDGNYIYIPKGCRHRMTNTSQEESLLYIEVQCGQYFGEDDIVRFEDNYGRA